MFFSTSLAYFTDTSESSDHGSHVLKMVSYEGRNLNPKLFTNQEITTWPFYESKINFDCVKLLGLQFSLLSWLAVL